MRLETHGVVVDYRGGATMTYSLNAHSPWEGYRVTVNGTRGRLVALNPFLPHLYYRLRVYVDGNERREKVAGQLTRAERARAELAAEALVPGGPEPVCELGGRDL